MDKLRAIQEQDFIPPDDAAPTPVMASSLEPTVDDRAMLKLKSYSNCTMALMEELRPLWRLHQTIVRWVDSEDEQQRLEYSYCRWDTADSNSSSTLAMNNQRDAVDLNSPSMSIKHMRAIRVRPKVLVEEVERSGLLPMQLLIPNNTQPQTLGDWCGNVTFA